MSEAHEYREYAAECLRLAEHEPKDRERWLKMAAQWTALAVKTAEIENPTADPD
jgi:hypothetical protein